MRWVGHVPCMAGSKLLAGVWGRNFKGRDHLENLGTDGKMMMMMMMIIIIIIKGS
jgi:hypothetical protein